MYTNVAFDTDGSVEVSLNNTLAMQLNTTDCVY